jgi:hypothetical protein
MQADSSTQTHDPVDVREGLTKQELYREYVNKRPVVMKGALRHLPAVEKWSIQYFASLAPDLNVRLKTGDLAKAQTLFQRLRDYGDLITNGDPAGRAGASRVPYLHDLPLFTMIPELRKDVEPFPAHLFPGFFRQQWWRFPQFFVGPAASLTPLHFDTLLTHNTFFQLHGSKRFIMVDADDRDKCDMFNWRWSHVNAEAPDFERHPLYRDARISECVVEAGDLLYMPPGTLHCVRSLNNSISFNVDWHDRYSAVRSLAALRQGMPRQNFRYNALFALGVCAKVPLRLLLPLLDSYFTYVS